MARLNHKVGASVACTMKFLCISFVIADCLSLFHGNPLSSDHHQESFMTQTQPGHNDVLIGPNHGEMTIIKAKMYIYHFKMVHSATLQFKVQMLIQLQWRDSRLFYQNFSDSNELLVLSPMMESIWLPHVLLTSDYHKSVIPSNVNDKTLVIVPPGDVLFSTRMSTNLICQTPTGNFPFDKQTCFFVLANPRNNANNQKLQWDDNQPFIRTFTSLTEFDMLGMDVVTPEHEDTVLRDFIFTEGLQMEDSVYITFRLGRKFGFYLWNYYVPSVILIVISWGTFWVDPQVVPCRVWLATCTMLGFFGLGAMNDTMPQLSRLKLNDIWFIGCNLFIFLSLAEFALVNIVHRQQTKNIPLKQVSSKYILKSSLRTESIPWRRKSISLPPSPELRQRRENIVFKRKHQKTVVFNLGVREITTDTKLRHQLSRRRKAFTGTLMTNQEMANWIDRRSRIVFPIAFVIFNLLFWIVMFI